MSPRKPFLRSTACQSGAHCSACRNSPAFVASLATVFADAPRAGEPAPCGRPWGWQGETQPIVTPDERAAIVARRRRICNECNDCDECGGTDRELRPLTACRLLLDPRKPCLLTSCINDLYAACPSGRWPAELATEHTESTEEHPPQRAQP